MNAIVIVANSLHTGYLGCYGNEWIRTPGLDRFASESVVFDHCVVECPRPYAVHRAWWSGRYGFTTDAVARQQLQFSDLILPEQLRKAGVRTALVTDNCLLREDAPMLERAFDDVTWIRGQAYDSYVAASKATVEVEDYPHLRLPPKDHPDHALWKNRWAQYLRNRTLVGSEEETCIARVIQSGVDWLDVHGDQQPFLLWLECFDPQSPWDPPEPYWSMYAPAEAGGIAVLVDPLPGQVGDVLSEEELDRLRQTYAAEVSLVDTWFRAFLEHLDRGGRLADTMIVVTSGYGVALGEHDWVGYDRGCLYEEIVHVPLMIRMPGAGTCGMRTAALVQNPDLLPTLVDAFDAPPLKRSRPIHGRSLLPLIKGETSAVREYAVAGATDAGGDAVTRQWSLRTPEWHLITSLEDDADEAVSELYVKPEDRWDINDTSEAYRDTAGNLEQTLRQFVGCVEEDRLERAPALQTGQRA